MIPNDDMINEAMAEAVREAYADGAFRKVPCRACGEVTFFPDPREEFCVDCCVEHHMMRLITLAPDRYCPHCDRIRAAQEGFGDAPVVWREEPSCLACGQAAYFPVLAPAHVAALCLHCEAAQTFDGDVFCPVCGTIEQVHLDQLLEALQDEWDALSDPGDMDGAPHGAHRHPQRLSHLAGGVPGEQEPHDLELAQSCRASVPGVARVGVALTRHRSRLCGWCPSGRVRRRQAWREEEE